MKPARPQCWQQQTEPPHSARQHASLPAPGMASATGPVAANQMQQMYLLPAAAPVDARQVALRVGMRNMMRSSSSSSTGSAHEQSSRSSDAGMRPPRLQSPQQQLSRNSSCTNTSWASPNSSRASSHISPHSSRASPNSSRSSHSGSRGQGATALEAMHARRRTAAQQQQHESASPPQPPCLQSSGPVAQQQRHGGAPLSHTYARGETAPLPQRCAGSQQSTAGIALPPDHTRSAQWNARYRNC